VHAAEGVSHVALSAARARFLTVAEVASLLRVSIMTVYRVDTQAG
jgi:hypothetical protein